MKKWLKFLLEGVDCVKNNLQQSSVLNVVSASMTNTPNTSTRWIPRKFTKQKSFPKE